MIWFFAILNSSSLHIFDLPSFLQRKDLNYRIEQDARLKDFIRVNVEINQSSPNYIRPLDRDITSVFDPKKDKYCKEGNHCLWVLRDDKGHGVGRIAAFVNKRYRNKGDRFKMGGIGFFDCIQDQKAADLLFDHAKSWLQHKGMEAMDGPINLGERDRWWGLLVEGFQPPPYGLNYNPPYYRELFENYGWKTFYEQICWNLPVSATADQLAPKFYEAHQNFASNPEFSAHHVNKKELGRFAEDFCQVYNEAWASHAGNKEMTVKTALNIFKAMKPIMDEKIVWFAYHKERPISMWINLPDINQIFKHFNGKLHLVNKLRFLWLKRQARITKMMGIAYGVVPEFQGSGVDYYMIAEGEKVLKAQTGYNELELQWQGDFNPKMINISKNLGAELARKLITYRYHFDTSVPVERHPVV
jgi:hypothetical protein